MQTESERTDPSLVKPQHLSEAHERILERALLSRETDNQLLKLFAEGKLSGTIHTCIGQEFVGAVIAEVLESGDSVFSNHRCHGHFLSVTGNAEGLIAEVMGKATGVAGGIGGSQHLIEDGFYSNGILGGIAPVTAGLALARELRAEGKLSVAFLGDGALGEGVIYETFNLASKWSLPCLFVVEDNGVAQSTDQAQTLAGTIPDRARAFAIPCFAGDTWNWQALVGVAKEAAAVARQGNPVMLHIHTFRLNAHSKGDDLRNPDLIDEFKQKDPLSLALKDPFVAHRRRHWEDQVKVAAKAAEQASYPTLSPDPKESHPATWEEASPHPRERVVARLNTALIDILKNNPKAIALGEDIESPYGGAFKVTGELSSRYPNRVRNTPISEAALIGVGTGLAMEGFRPFVEIMFGDFLGLGFDQLVNHAAKFTQMYGRAMNLDLVVRTPMGAGRGYGPTHSQSTEKHFLGVPGLRVLSINHLSDPYSTLVNLSEGEYGPTLLIENKLLYGAYLVQQIPQGFTLMRSEEAFSASWLQPQCERVDLTLVGYGGLSPLLLEVADQLFEQCDLVTQVFIPQQLYPFSAEPYRSVFEKGSRLVVVEEGQGFAAFGTELATQLCELGLPQKVLRIGPPRFCIPASRPLEAAYLPSQEAILNQVKGWIDA